VRTALWMLVLLTALRTEAAATFHLNSANTQVSFFVERLGIHWLTARFGDIRGDFTIDRQGSSSRVDVSVGTASLDCDQPRWNERLRSPEWLDVQHFPQMTYRSSGIELGEGGAVARGELTLHGMTRPVVLNVILLNCASAGSCQFTANARIRRSDYGLPHGFWTGGDQVEISISGAVADASR
jgi:polyisoprenoid-binding protein YceI